MPSDKLYEYYRSEMSIISGIILKNVKLKLSFGWNSAETVWLNMFGMSKENVEQIKRWSVFVGWKENVNP